MTKKTTIFMTTLAALLCSATLITVPNAYATETTENTNTELENYYDLNTDGEFSIADAVIANQLLNDGRFSKQDFLNVCELIVGNEINMSFEEFDLEGMEVSNSTISKIEATVSSYCVGYDFDGITVTYRYLNNGVISEMHCSDIAISERTIAIPVYNNIQNVIGVSPEGTFVIDAARSFDLPHDFNVYEVWDLDNVTPAYANFLMHTSGAYENFITTPDHSLVQIWFNNDVTITELRARRIAPIEKELKSFVYEDEKITVGVTADGKVAVNITSFDIDE